MRFAVPLHLIIYYLDTLFSWLTRCRLRFPCPISHDGPTCCHHVARLNLSYLLYSSFAHGLHYFFQYATTQMPDPKKPIKYWRAGISDSKSSGEKNLRLYRVKSMSSRV